MLRAALVLAIILLPASVEAGRHKRRLVCAAVNDEAVGRYWICPERPR